MKRLSRLKLTAPSPWERERLARWLHEWEIRTLLATGGRSAALPGSASVSDVACAHTEPVDDAAAVRAGDIRLLAPLRSADRTGPVYLLIVTHDGSHVVAIPFGNMSEPATPGELLAKTGVAGLAVLCFWNARILARDAWPQSWTCGRVSDADVSEYRRAWHHVRERQVLPDELRQRGGAPLVHPADPRHDYLCLERTRIDTALGVPTGLTYPLPTRDELPKAADPPADYTPDDKP